MFIFNKQTRFVRFSGVSI